VEPAPSAKWMLAFASMTTCVWEGAKAPPLHALPR
jgi:hypothetical protein